MGIETSRPWRHELDDPLERLRREVELRNMADDSVYTKHSMDEVDGPAQRFEYTPSDNPQNFMHSVLAYIRGNYAGR